MLSLAALVGSLTLSVAGPTPASHDTVEAVRLAVAPAGNEARYRVREQLANFQFPNDAVGATSAISGAIVLDTEGAVLADRSRITVDLRTLRSDRDRRDGYLQRRTLDTATYPEAVLVPTGVRGLPWPLPASGSVQFQLVGNLTVRDRTFPTTWEVTATLGNGEATGKAITRFTFDHAGLERPRVAIVLSVDETITLEYDFRFLVTRSR